MKISARDSAPRGARVMAALVILCAGPVVAQEASVTGAAQPAQFAQTCALCHGSDAAGTDRAPPLVNSRQLHGASETDIEKIIRGGRGNMPSFSYLPQPQIQALAYYVRSLNAVAFDMKPPGDAAAGADVFFGSGRCIECHTARGRGGVNGPDLSNIGHVLTLAQLEQSLLNPTARVTAGYEMVDVRLRDGNTLHGFARTRGVHSIALQTLDGRLHLLLDSEYTRVDPLKSNIMPAFDGTPGQYRDVIAFLSTLTDVPEGPNPSARGEITPSDIDAVLHPKPGEWPTYSGTVEGNRYSPLHEINARNVAMLRTAWIHPVSYNALETTPIVVDGVMYVTAPNEVDALDARTGSQIWTYSRPRSTAQDISGDAAKGANRGVAVLGSRIFFITDNAHLICLEKLTGALLWDVSLRERPGRYGGTSAPLVVGDLVIAGVSGGDEDIRGLVTAYKATTGEQAWRFWTVPEAGDPEAATWKGSAVPRGGGSWTTGSYDPETGTLYVSTGNPYPDTDGDDRGGDNLYTDSDLALDAKTGKLRWYFQFTPHDLHDWDANQPLALVDAPFHGTRRKLLLHANRNGFFYVLDRTNGKLLQASALVKRLTWASGIGADGRPTLLPNNETTTVGVMTCPAVRGATNWYSTSYNPATGLYYVMTSEDCSIYRKAHDGGYGRVNDPTNPPMKVLRAIGVETGKIAWELPLPGSPELNYSGVLSTAGGLVFFGETGGGFAAVDAATGKSLWHFETNQQWKGSPMTYTIEGHQYVAIASASTILSFRLPDR